MKLIKYYRHGDVLILVLQSVGEKPVNYYFNPGAIAYYQVADTEVFIVLLNGTELQFDAPDPAAFIKVALDHEHVLL